MRKALGLCEGYLSILLEEDWRPGTVVSFSMTAMFSKLNLSNSQGFLFHELVERVRDAGWTVTLDLDSDDKVISIS